MGVLLRHCCSSNVLASRSREAWRRGLYQTREGNSDGTLRDGEGDRDVCSLVWLPLDLM